MSDLLNDLIARWKAADDRATETGLPDDARSARVLLWQIRDLRREMEK